MILLIDIGNTSSKLAVAQGHEILHTERLAEPWAAALRRLTEDYGTAEKIVVSCVGKEGAALQEALEGLQMTATWLSCDTPCAIGGVPKGYGADRLAADLGAYSGQHALLVVDAGTCITYDFIVDGRLAGGVISPGVQLRLNAMHDYTAALPRVEAAPLPYSAAAEDGAPAASKASALPLMANTTEGCMLSAALHGVRFEMEGYIRSLRREYPDLEVVLTGGNRFMLAEDIRYSYDPLLVIKGLAMIDE